MGSTVRRDAAAVALGLALGVVEVVAMLLLLVPGIVFGSWSVGLEIDAPVRAFQLADARASYVTGLAVIGLVAIAASMQRERGERRSGLVVAIVATITCVAVTLWIVGTEDASWAWVVEDAPAIVGSIVGLVALAMYPVGRAPWITTAAAYVATVALVEVAALTAR